MHRGEFLDPWNMEPQLELGGLCPSSLVGALQGLGQLQRPPDCARGLLCQSLSPLISGGQGVLQLFFLSLVGCCDSSDLLSLVGRVCQSLSLLISGGQGVPQF